MVNKSDKDINGAPRIFQEAFRHRDAAFDALLDTDLNYKSLSEKEDAASLAVNSISSSNPFYTNMVEQLSSVQQQRLSYEQNLSNIENKKIASTIETYTKTGNINKRTTTAAQTQRYRNLARTSEEINWPTQMIQEQIQSRIESVNGMAAAHTKNVLGLEAFDKTSDILEGTSNISAGEHEISRLKAIEKLQRRSGKSTEKLLNKGEDLESDIDAWQNNRAITNRVRTGNFGSAKEEVGRLETLRTERSNAQIEYDKAVAEGAENILEFNKNLIAATGALDDQFKLVKAMGNKGIDDGQGFRNAMVGLGAVGAMGTTAVAIGVNNKNEEMNIRTGYANIGNNLWDKSKQAVQGHSIDAMMEVMGSKSFADYATSQKGFSNVVGGTGKAVAHAANIALGASSIISTDPTGSVGKVISEAASASIDMDRVRRGSYGGAQGLESYSAIQAMGAAGRHIDASQMQDYMNYGMSTYRGTRGAGSGSSLQREMMDMKNVNGFAEVGITPEQAAASAGVLSKAGYMGAGAGVNIIKGAGLAQQRGQMGQEEYVSAAARLVGMGGKDSDLEDIIATATEKGMDNSKNIGQMVDATISLSASTAARGVGATGAVQDMLGGYTQSLVGGGHERNLAISMAARGVQAFDEVANNKQQSFGNIIQEQQIRGMKEFRSFDVGAINKIKGFTTSDMLTLRAGGNAGRTMARDIGMEKQFYDESGNVKTDVLDELGKVRVRRVLQDGGDGSMMYSASIMKKLQNKEKLSDEEKRSLPANVTEETLNSEFGNVTTVTNRKRKYAPLDAGGELMKTAAQQASANAIMGEKGSGGMGAIAAAMKDVVKAIDPKTWAEETRKAASEFRAPAADFKEGSKQFSAAVDKFVKSQGANLQKMGKDKNDWLPSSKKDPESGKRSNMNMADML